MNTLQAITAATETVATYGARAYVLGGEIFTVGSILWVLSFMSGMVENTYKAGAAVGTFYRAHVHQFTLAAIALVILGAQLAYEGAILLYQNREDILDTLNEWRNYVGDKFTYTSPALA